MTAFGCVTEEQMAKLLTLKTSRFAFSLLYTCGFVARLDLT